jgi:fluoroquinolone transport system permease protein
VSLLTGAVVGFMILDERDERTLLQLAVSPLGRRGYLAYRMTLPVLVGFAVGSVTLAFSSLVNVPVGRLAAVMAVASLGAPPVALLLASFAPSKVEGIALNKAVGAVIVLPAAAYLIPRQWEISMLPVSPYWVMRAIQTAAGPPSVFYKYVLLTAVANLFWVIVLSRAFSRSID